MRDVGNKRYIEFCVMLFQFIFIVLVDLSFFTHSCLSTDLLKKQK